MSRRKALVIGVDGMDPRICRRLMAENALPHLAALAEYGTFTDLATSNPPQSPVAWTCVAAGTNPGRHGIFDFLVRDPKRLLPELSLLRRKRSKLGVVRHVRPFEGKTFWDLAAEAGLPSVVLRWPLTFPPGNAGAAGSKGLAGLGAPDVKGRLGNYVFYTESDDPGTARGATVRVKFRDGRAELMVEGPANAGGGTALSLSRADGRLDLSVSGRTIALRPGAWSDWLPLCFGPENETRIKGIARVFPTSLEPLGLYLGPIQVDPREPCLPIASPEAYAAELADALGGPYATLGMPEETKGLTEGRLSDEAFLDMCDDITTERERMFDFELGRFDEGLLACVFDTSDRIQHMFWRLFDPAHPLYDPKAAKRLGPIVEDHYRRMDAVVGRAVAAADDDTALLVCSDHGFASYTRTVHLNTWLAEEGFLSLKDRDPDDAGELFRHVDWAGTRAYAMGFGSIYLNLAEREKHGQVRPGEEAQTLARELASRLAGLTDETGAAAVNRVYFRDEICEGPLAADAPDLVVGWRPPFRVSWTTAIGGVGPGVFEDNNQKWSGDHCVDAALVPGSLFSNRRFDLGGQTPSQTRLAATILNALGLPPGSGMEPGLG